MKSKIKHFCETCNVRLNKRNFLKHYNQNHDIRTTGTFVVSEKDCNVQVLPKTLKGVALTNVKAGESVVICLE